MNIISPEREKQVFNESTRNVSKLLSKEEVEVVRIRLEPEGNLPNHTTPVDVFFYIISGTGIVEIGEEHEQVKEGMLVESPKDIPHGLHNTTEEPFEVLVVKTPRP